ncbi:MAG: TIGR00341 family protein [Rhodothermales bacterium]
MALQQVDLYVADASVLPTALDDEASVVARWEIDMEGSQKLVRFLVETESTETLLERLHERIGDEDAYRIVVTNVEATLPRLEPKEEAETPNEETPGRKARISREELYQDIDDAIRTTKSHYTLVVLSTLVAAIGLLRANVAVIIGAMVIAPLIGPNIALALGTTLADTDLLKRAMRINIAGLLLGLALSFGIGLLLPVDPNSPEIAARTEVTLADMALALAAGVAGALSMTRGVSSALIGVMVAVALMPPLVVVGMMLGAGFWQHAYRAGLLLITNLTAINLAGIVTFLIQGIRPMRWYETEKARKATRLAILLWAILLAILIAAILLGNPASY